MYKNVIEFSIRSKVKKKRKEKRRITSTKIN